jgi:hypothetical protein
MGGPPISFKYGPPRPKSAFFGPGPILGPKPASGRSWCTDRVRYLGRFSSLVTKTCAGVDPVGMTSTDPAGEFLPVESV